MDDALRGGALAFAMEASARAALLGVDLECVEVVPRHDRKGRVDMVLTMWSERADGGGWERLTLGPDGELMTVQAPSGGAGAEVVNLFPKGVE